MYPFPPSSFYLFIYPGKKKKIALHPSTVKEQEEKKSRCTLSRVP